MKIILTQPSEAIYPTQDNADGNLVVAKGDRIVKSETVNYMAIELLGVGTFGQVFRCVSNEGEEVAIKVVKSQNKYYQYEMNEIRILKKLQEAKKIRHFVELYDAFIYRQHLCIVVELLGPSTYEITKMMKFSGMDHASVRYILLQLMEGIQELHNFGIIHSDLKPENILVVDLYSLKIKVIDFGSSTTRPMMDTFYIQSRYYRAPEVMLEIPYSAGIDIWSAGCIAYELLMGHPLFPGSSNQSQLQRIHRFYEGGIPSFMIEYGEKASNVKFAPDGECEDDYITLERMVKQINDASPASLEENTLFIDLVLYMLNPSYLERPSASEILKHDYFTYVPKKKESYYGTDDRGRHTVKSVARDVQRKMSLIQFSQRGDDEDIGGRRKKSVMDLGSENKHNRKFL